MSKPVDLSPKACAERREYLAQQRARDAAAARAAAGTNPDEAAFKAEQARLNQTR